MRGVYICETLGFAALIQFVFLERGESKTIVVNVAKPSQLAGEIRPLRPRIPVHLENAPSCELPTDFRLLI